eukprot:COSAG04_NODE_6048_length_1422_cov_1.050642_1_plen_361_part_10
MAASRLALLVASATATSLHSGAGDSPAPSPHPLPELEFHRTDLLHYWRLLAGVGVGLDGATAQTLTYELYEPVSPAASGRRVELRGGSRLVAPGCHLFDLAALLETPPHTPPHRPAHPTMRCWPAFRTTAAKTDDETDLPSFGIRSEGGLGGAGSRADPITRQFAVVQAAGALPPATGFLRLVIADGGCGDATAVWEWAAANSSASLMLSPINASATNRTALCPSLRGNLTVRIEAWTTRRLHDDAGAVLGRSAPLQLFFDYTFTAASFDRFHVRATGPGEGEIEFVPAAADAAAVRCAPPRFAPSEAFGTGCTPRSLVVGPQRRDEPRRVLLLPGLAHRQHLQRNWTACLLHRPVRRAAG